MCREKQSRLAMLQRLLYSQSTKVTIQLPPNLTSLKSQGGFFFFLSFFLFPSSSYGQRAPAIRGQTFKIKQNKHSLNNRNNLVTCVFHTTYGKSLYYIYSSKWFVNREAEEAIFRDRDLLLNRIWPDMSLSKPMYLFMPVWGNSELTEDVQTKPRVQPGTVHVLKQMPWTDIVKYSDPLASSCNQ